MPSAPTSQLAVCLSLTRAISRTTTVEEIYEIALDTLASGLGVSRASILLFDPDGVMRFKAFRQLSEGYRAAVEGHTPWRPDSPNPAPFVVPDVTADAGLAPYLPTVQAEGIAAMAFIPLVSSNRVIGKFMLYYGRPRQLDDDELQLASVIASQVAFAVERTRAEDQARRSEARLRFALDAASMGTWDWDLGTNVVAWSDNLERIHGLPPGTFDGSFESYEREIHPDDRGRVLASVQRALSEGIPHDVEYRLVAPDGSIRWAEGKGLVEYENGAPVRMSGVCMIVTRRKEAELARLAAAEEAARLKDEFLATLSHELRTPLNAIVGWVHLLDAPNLGPERIRQAIDVIGRNAKIQGQLVEDILDVSRIISGKLEIDRLPVHLSQLVDAVVAACLPAAAAKRLRVKHDVPAGLPAIEGDPKRLTQVLSNVVANAIKFTPDGGTVDIQTFIDDRAIELRVRDSGVGIAPEFLPYVFDRFRQADSRVTRRHGGLGLGLAIARHLIEQHQGTIRAHSDGEGRGTTIVMRIPLHLAAEPVVALPADAVAAFGLHGVTAAVVDDQPDSREVVSVLLEQCGARAVRCDSARAALDALASTPVHLLVADIAMPDVDGYELMRRVRVGHAALPAIAVSAYAHPEDRRRALASGYRGYCAKPIDATEFLRTVRDLVTPPATS